jgi:uncharacterized phage protein (TIGR01671 family)
MEIDFKAKVIKNDPKTNPSDGWVHGFYLEDIRDGSVKSFIFNCPNEWKVEKNTLCQYIGRKDKKGKNIYFGDNVKKHCIETNTDQFGVVIFIEDSIKINIPNDSMSSLVDYESNIENIKNGKSNYITLHYDYEVIGNMFDDYNNENKG